MRVDEGGLQAFVQQHRREFDEKCEDGFGRLEVLEALVPQLLERIAWLEAKSEVGENIVGQTIERFTVLVDRLTAALPADRAAPAIPPSAPTE